MGTHIIRSEDAPVGAYASGLSAVLPFNASLFTNATAPYVWISNGV